MPMPPRGAPGDADVRAPSPPALAWEATGVTLESGASITVVHANRHERAICDILNDAAFKSDWWLTYSPITPASLRGSSPAYCYDAPPGLLRSVGTSLEQLEASYWGQQDPSGGGNGYCRMFTPGLGVFEGIGAADSGEVLIDATNLADALAVSKTLADARLRIDALAGGPWRRRLGLEAEVTTIALARRQHASWKAHAVRL